MRLLEAITWTTDLPRAARPKHPAASFAQTNDTLTFTVAGAKPNTVTDIAVFFTVDGGMTVNTAAGDSSGSLQTILSLGGASLSDVINACSNRGNDPGALYTLPPGADGLWLGLVQRHSDRTGHGSFLVRYDGTIMMSRTQITLDPEIQRQVRQRASDMGISLAEYVRRLVVRDLGGSHQTVKPSAVFDLGKSGGSDIASNKDAMLADAFISQRRKRRRR